MERTSKAMTLNVGVESSRAPVETGPMKITVIMPKRDKLNHHINHSEEMYSLFMEPLYKDSRFTNVYSYKMFGDSLCEVYSKMLDSLFILYKRQHILSCGTTQTIRTVFRTLPRCFAVTNQCHIEADVLFGIANVAFQALFAEQNTLETIYIIPSIYSTCLEIGLLIEKFLKKDTVEFSHQRFIEFLAALYIAMCTEDEREKELCLLYSFCVSFESSLLLSQLLVFMSGMCPDVVTTILRFVANIINNEKCTYLYRNNGSLSSRPSEYINMFHNLQDLVLMCAQECRANKFKDIAFSEFSLQDIIISNSRSYDRCLLSSLIEHNSSNIKSVFIEETSPEHLDVLMPALLHCHYLQTIVLSCALSKRKYAAILQLLQHNINLKCIWLDQVNSDQADSESNNDNSENIKLELNLSNHIQLRSLHIRAAICILISEANMINLNNFCVDVTQWTPYECSHMLTCLTKASKLQKLELNCISIAAKLLRSIVDSISCHQHSVSVNLSNCSIMPKDGYLKLIHDMLASGKFVISSQTPLCFKFKTKGAMTQNYVPSSPTKATFTNKTSDGLMLEWKKPVNDGGDEIEAYYVLQKVDTCDWKEIATLAPYTTKYQIKGLKPDTCYTFAVVAENKIGRSAPIVTNNLRYTRLKATVPSSPIGPVTILDNQANSFLISWQPSGDRSTLSRYYIEIREASNSTWSLLAEVQPCVTSYNVQKLKIHKEYIFRIFAQNGVGISDALVSKGVIGKSSNHNESPEKCTTKSEIWQFNGLKEELFGYMINTRAKLSSTSMFKDRRFKGVFNSILIDESMCTVYSLLIDAIFKHSKMKTSTTITTSVERPIFKQLPRCFNVTDRCISQSELLFGVANLAFNLLFIEQQKPTLIIPKSVTDKLLSKSILSTCLKIGLLDEIDTNNIKFPCKSMQEFLAALYISMCNMTERENALRTLNSCCTSIDAILNMSQVLQFMCGMCPKVVSLLSATMNSTVSNDGKTEWYRTEKEHRLIISEPLTKTLTNACNNEVDRMVMEKATFWNYLEIFYNLQRMNIVCAQESIANMCGSFTICLQDIVVINNKTMDTLMLKILIEQQPDFIRSVLLYKPSNEQCDSLLLALLNCQKLQTFRSKDCILNPKQVLHYHTIIKLNTDLAYVWLDQCNMYSCVNCSELLNSLKAAAKLQSLKIKGVRMTASSLGGFFYSLSNQNYCTNVILFGCEIVPFEDYQRMLNMIRTLPGIAISNVDHTNFCCSISTLSDSQHQYTKNNLYSDKTKLDSNHDCKTEVAVKTNIAKPSVQKIDNDTLFDRKGISVKGNMHPRNVNVNKNSTTQNQEVKSISKQRNLTTVSKKNLPNVKTLKGADVNVDMQKGQNRKAALCTDSCEKHLKQVPLVDVTATIYKKAESRKKSGRQRKNKKTTDPTKEAHSSPYHTCFVSQDDLYGYVIDNCEQFLMLPFCKDPRFKEVFDNINFDTSLCEVYSKLAESFFIRFQEITSTVNLAKTPISRAFPCFFSSIKFNKQVMDLIFDVTKLAFRTMFRQQLYVNGSLMNFEHIQDAVFSKCTHIGLLISSRPVQFVHTNMQEFLAALYIAMCTSNEKQIALNIIYSRYKTTESFLEMSLMLQFLCGLCPEVVISVAKQISRVTNKDVMSRRNKSNIEEHNKAMLVIDNKNNVSAKYGDVHICIQRMMSRCTKECKANTHENINWFLEKIVLLNDENTDNLILNDLSQQNKDMIKIAHLYEPSQEQLDLVVPSLLDCQNIEAFSSKIGFLSAEQFRNFIRVLLQCRNLEYLTLNWACTYVDCSELLVSLRAQKLRLLHLKHAKLTAIALRSFVMRISNKTQRICVELMDCEIKPEEDHKALLNEIRSSSRYRVTEDHFRKFCFSKKPRAKGPVIAAENIYTRFCLSLSWIEHGEDVVPRNSSYSILKRDDTRKWKVIAQHELTNYQCILTHSKLNQCVFAVVAENISTITCTVTAALLVDKPSVPLGPVEFNGITQNSVVVSWNPSENNGGAALTRYYIEKREASESSWTFVAEVKPYSISCYVNELQECKEYFFRIFAENKIGTSDALLSQSLNPFEPISETAAEPHGYYIHQIYKLALEPLFKDTMYPAIQSYRLYGESLCEMYSTMIDSFFIRLYNKHGAKITLSTNSVARTLPSCFLVTKLCLLETDFLFHIAIFAIKTLFSTQNKTAIVIDKAQVERYLPSLLHLMCLEIGLLTERSIKDGSVQFAYKSLHQFFAALYFTMCTEKETEDTLNTFLESCNTIQSLLNMAQVLIFMSGMCPNVVSVISKKIGEMRKNMPYNTKHSVGCVWKDMCHNVQGMILMCAQESRANNYKHINLFLQDIVIESSEPMDLQSLPIIIKKNQKNIVSLYYKASIKQYDLLMPALWKCQNIQRIELSCTFNHTHGTSLIQLIQQNRDLRYIHLRHVHFDNNNSNSCIMRFFNDSKVWLDLKGHSKLVSVDVHDSCIWISAVNTLNIESLTIEKLYGYKCSELLKCLTSAPRLNYLRLAECTVNGSDLCNFIDALLQKNHSVDVGLCGCKITPRSDFYKFKDKIHSSHLIVINKFGSEIRFKTALRNTTSVTEKDSDNNDGVNNLGIYGCAIAFQLPESTESSRLAVVPHDIPLRENQVTESDSDSDDNDGVHNLGIYGHTMTFQLSESIESSRLAVVPRDIPLSENQGVDRDSSGSDLYKLYKLSMGTHFDKPAFSSIFSHNECGKSLCKVYSKMLESLLVVSNETHVASATATESVVHTGQRKLPRCFEGYDRCSVECEFLHDICIFAFQTTVTGYLEQKLMLVDTIKDLLSPQEYTKCFQARLLTESLVHFGHAQFPSKLMQQFLAALYFSMCNTDEKEEALRVFLSCCGSLKSLLKMSQLFLFMSGMCPDVVSSMAHQIADIVNCEQCTHRHRTSSSCVDIFHYLQDMWKLCVNESMANNNETIILPLQDLVIMASDFDDLVGLSTLIEQNQCDIKSLYYQPSTNKSDALLQDLLKCRHLMKIESSNISTHNQCYTIFQLLQQNKEIRYVNLKNIHINEEYHAVELDEDDSNDYSLDLSRHSQLTSIDLYDTCIQIKAINTTNLEHLSIYVDKTSWFDCSDLLRSFTTNHKLHSLMLKNCVIESSSLYSLLDAILQCKHSVNVQLRECTVTPMEEYDRLMEEIKISPRICVSHINSDELNFKTLWNIQRSIAENTNGRNNTIEALSASADINSNKELVPPQKPVDYNSIMGNCRDFYGFYRHKLYRLFMNVHFNNPMISAIYKHQFYGESLCNIYSRMLDSQLVLFNKKKGRTSYTSTVDNSIRKLPSCFEGAKQCKQDADFLFSTSCLAFQTVCAQQLDICSVNDKAKENTVPRSSVYNMCIDIGLLNKTSSQNQGEQLSFEPFSAFFVALYIAMCSDPEREEVLETLYLFCDSIQSILRLSRVLLFMSGMCPDVVASMAQYLADIVRCEACTKEHRAKGSWEDTFCNLQELMILCAQECKANNQGNLTLFLQDIVVMNSRSLDLATLSSLIEYNQCNIMSLYYKPSDEHSGILLPSLLACKYLQRIESSCVFTESQCKSFVKFLQQNTNLMYISLQHQVHCRDKDIERDRDTSDISAFQLDLSGHTQLISIECCYSCIQIASINTLNLIHVNICMEKSFAYDCTALLISLVNAQKLMSLSLAYCEMESAALRNFVYSSLSKQHSIFVRLQICKVTPENDYQRLKEDLKALPEFCVTHVDNNSLQFRTVLHQTLSSGVSSNLGTLTVHNLSYCDIKLEMVDLQEDNCAQIKDFYILHQEEQGQWHEITKLKSFHHPYKIKGITPKRNHVFVVVAEKVVAESGCMETTAYSLIRRKMNKPSPPLGPVEFSCVQYNSVEISWQPSVIDQDSMFHGYRIEIRDATESTWSFLDKVEPSLTWYCVKGLEEHKKYYFRIIALSQIEYSEGLVSKAIIVRSEHNQDYHGYFSQQLYKKFLMPLFMDIRFSTIYNYNIFKESLSEVYCKMFDLLFVINSKNTTGIANVEATKDVMRNLPKCFEVTNQCKNETDFLFAIAKHTYQELFLQKQDTFSVFGNSKHHKQILASVICNCLGTRLQMDTSLHMGFKQISTEIFHEFLTAVYIAMCTADEKNKTLNTIFSLCSSIRSIFEMSQLFVFMSGMCPEVVSSMIQHIVAIVNNEQCTLEHRTEGGWDDIFQYLQDLMVMCAQESQANTHIAWSLQDVVVMNSTSIDLMTLSVLIQENQQNIKSLCYKPTNEMQVELLHVLLKCRHLQRIESKCIFTQDQYNAFIELLTQNTDLQYLSLEQVQCINMDSAISEYVLDLSKHTQIKSIQMKHTSIQIRTINTDNLECISICMEPTFRYDCSDILTCLSRAPKLLSLNLENCLLNCTLLCRFVVMILQNQHSVCVNLQGCIVTPVEDYQKLKEHIKTSNRFIVDHANHKRLQFMTVLLTIEPDTLEHMQRYKYIFKANGQNKQEHVESIPTQLYNDFQTVLKVSRHAYLVAQDHLLDKSDSWDVSNSSEDEWG